MTTEQETDHGARDVVETNMPDLSEVSTRDLLGVARIGGSVLSRALVTVAEPTTSSRPSISRFSAQIAPRSK